MPTDVLKERVSRKLGFNGERAERVINAVLAALGRQLDAVHADIVARRLSASRAARLRRDNGADNGADAMFGAVAHLLQVRPAAAREATIAVCQSLASVLDDEALQNVRTDVDPVMAGWFQPGTAPAAPAPERVRPVYREGTLAGGRPAASNPIGEGHPVTAGHLDESNPHQDRKLSSAGASSVQRHGTTLADGGPRSGRPVTTEG